jgi:NADPH:quinone reductase-like Zn-dependent oxidoreductase
MKAIVCPRYGPPEVLEVRDVKKPVPKAKEILVRVHATAVTATDPVMRKGEPFIVRFFTGLTKPIHPIPGDVFAGEVEEVGRDVTRFKKGDQVFGATGTSLGAQAEYVCLPETAALAVKPLNLSYEDAVCIVDGGLGALELMRKAGIRKGQDVLVNGASGSVGTFAIQLARHFGTEVTAVCSTTNLELVKSLGADRVIDYTREDFTRSGQRYDLIFDVVTKSSFSRCRGVLKPGGTYIPTAPSGGHLLSVLWTRLFGSRKALMAAPGLMPPAERAKDLVFLSGLFEQGKLRSVIDRTYPLEQIAEAHRYVEEGHKKGNVVLLVGPGMAAAPSEPATN